MAFFTSFNFTSKPLFLRMGEASRSVSKLLVLRSVVGNMIRLWSPAPNHVGTVPTLLTSERIALSRTQLNRRQTALSVNQKRRADPEHSTSSGGLSPALGYRSLAPLSKPHKDLL